MTKTIKEKIKNVGRMLAQSMMDTEIKKTILKNGKNLRESDVNVLYDVLNKEQQALIELEKSAKDFSDNSRTRWKEAADMQKNSVGPWLEESYAALIKGD